MDQQQTKLNDELKHLRGYYKQVFRSPEGKNTNIARLYQTPIFYENKLGVGDGDGRMRKIDATLKWDETKRAWIFVFNNFHPAIPEYADEFIEFRDVFHDKDITIGLRPYAQHVKGRLVESIAETTNGYNAVIYDDAFGTGVDLIVHPTATGLRKLVRVREYARDKDMTFDFEMRLPATDASVALTKKEHKEKGGVNAKRQAAIDLAGGKKIIIGSDKNGNKNRENFTYIKPVRIWDSGKPGKDSGSKSEIAHAQILTKDGKKILRKTIPAEFLKNAVGEVFTDATTTIQESKDTYYGTVYETGGQPDADNFWTGGWGDWYYSFLEWDLTGSPEDDKTLWAKIWLKVNSVGTNNPAPLIYMVTSAWTEAGVTSANVPTYTTSYGMYLTNPITIGAGNWDNKEMTHIYRFWKNGGYANYGLKIHATANSDSVSSYYSSDHATESYRPYLEVAYVDDTNGGVQKQLIPGGLPIANLNNGATAYAAIQGHGSAESWTTTYNWRRTLIANSGTIRRIYYHLGSAPGSEKNYKFTLYRNLSAVWSTTISDLNTSSYFDLGLNITAGDDLVLACTPTGTPTATTLQWGIEFWSADKNYVIAAGSGGAPAADGTTNYNNAAVGGSWFPNTNYTIENIMPHACRLKRFMFKVSTAPGAGKSWTIKALVGGSEVASITLSDTNTYVTADIDADINAGNHLMISITGAGTPSTSSFIGWGFAVEPDVLGESAIMGATANAWDNTQTTYNRVCASYASAENATRANVQRTITFGAQVLAAKVKRLVARVSTAPTAGKSWDISLEKNGSDAISLNIADTDLYNWNTVDEVAVSAQDLLNIKMIPNSSPAAGTGRWSFVVYIAPSPVVKDLALAYAVTLTVRNKTLQYAIVSPTDITKTLAYSVETSPAVTKTTAYRVLTAGAVMKDLAYTVVSPAEISKTLAYTVKSTPAEITKGLEYSVLTETAITKDTQYAVKAPVAITKALAYTVGTVGAITKGLAYAIRTEPAITKGTQYAVKSPVAAAKDLEYAINTQQAVTKALAYAVKTAQAVTKALTYGVLTTSGITKGAEYQVRTSDEITLGAEYTVKSPAEITRALAYAVKTANELTKALAYQVTSPSAITKGAQYAVTSPVEVTKTLAYEINLVYTHEITKAMAYTVLTASELTKGMAYAIQTEIGITKGLLYAVKAPQELTKGLVYALLTANELTKGLAYAIVAEGAITKGLEYQVTSEQAVTKGLQYAVVAPQEITRALAYAVLTAPEITKGLAYAILTSGALTKGLAYAVTTEQAITKGLQYSVLTENALTKGLAYEIVTAQEIQKGLAYAVITEEAITKALGYAILTTAGITKGLEYGIVVEGGVTKGLAYDVITTHAITKGMEYVLQINPYFPLPSPYTPKSGIYTAKQSPYGGRTSPYTPKGGIYTPLPGRTSN